MKGKIEVASSGYRVTRRAKREERYRESHIASRTSLFTALFMLLINVNFALAQGSIAELDETSLASEELVVLDNLEGALVIIEEMQKAGFNTTRVKDSFEVAETLFLAQLGRNETGRTYDEVNKKNEEIRAIRKNAFAINDELKVLEASLNRVDKGVDISEAQSLYNLAVQDFRSERYETARENINKAYDSISEAEAAHTQSAILVQATRSLGEKIILAWKGLGIAAVVIAVSLYFGLNRSRRIITEGRLRHLELEKKILEDLIQRTQKTYFEKGTMAETSYHIRMKKYADLIRDINRQVPLLYEELEGAKILKKAKKKQT